MPLSVGDHLGPYEILAPLGAGGMGEVYRARDTKLDRDVAIKVLPAALAQDPERLARFEREAKVLASLNHPNIAQIYGLEQRALVMELVEGETLQAPLPVETAPTITRLYKRYLLQPPGHVTCHSPKRDPNVTGVRRRRNLVSTCIVLTQGSAHSWLLKRNESSR